MHGRHMSSPAEQFRDEYVGESSMGLCRHVPAHVGDTHEDLAIPDPDRLIQPDVGVIRDIDGRDGAVSIEFPEGGLVKTPDFF